MITITEIAFVCYPITDAPRARRFYETVLGLAPTATFEHEGKHWVEYDIGAGTLAITSMGGDKWKPSSQGPSAALEVADFDAAVGTLRAAAVTFSLEPMDSGVCRMAIVQDPDGNSLGIHQRRRPAG